GLERHGYIINEEDGLVVAEEGRFSRWGPYVQPNGLIIILLGAILRQTPLFFLDEYVWVREGEQIVIPGTDGENYVENKKFTLETDDEDHVCVQEVLERQGDVASNYQTDVVVYQAQEADVTDAEPELTEMKEEDMRMNQPLKFDAYSLYQSIYQLDELSELSFIIHETDNDDKKPLAKFTIDELMDPESTYELD